MFNSKNDIALSCLNVSKSFEIQNQISLWRLLMGLNDNNESLIEAIRDVSLQVPRGQIVGIIGRNGAGKSTLLRLLGQVYTPTKGRIEVFGQIAGLFELGGMGNPNLTGREYAIRYLQFMGIPKQDLERTLTDIFDFSELGDAFDWKIRTYSSGMSARLYFSVATAYQHEIYLIDELLSVGDEHFQIKCWRRIRERLLNGASGVLVTHDWTAIIKLCQIACVIEHGTFSFVGFSDRAVVNYLKLPVPAATAARIGVTLLDEYKYYTGQFAEINIPVEIIESGRVDCAISIEVLHVGIGWEVILLSEFSYVGHNPGFYKAIFSIASLPLVPGNYSLNIFLRHELSDAGDCRSWTYGNGLKLIVLGKNTECAVKLPYKVRRVSGDPT